MENIEIIKCGVKVGPISKEDSTTIWDALYGRRSQLLAAGINDELSRTRKDQLERLMDLFHID